MQIELRFIEKKKKLFLGIMKEISKKVLRVNYFVLLLDDIFIVDFFLFASFF